MSSNTGALLRCRTESEQPASRICAMCAQHEPDNARTDRACIRSCLTVYGLPRAFDGSTSMTVPAPRCGCFTLAFCENNPGRTPTPSLLRHSCSARKVVDRLCKWRYQKMPKQVLVPSWLRTLLRIQNLELCCGQTGPGCTYSR